ncbi:hypothetical protein HN958_03880 [Candidatus Falkowbacteria bacterium]|jgi:hypothetical protein|nr:hypothetical protein [Candidatus Falkowbacteria bacterium]
MKKRNLFVTLVVLAIALTTIACQDDATITGTQNIDYWEVQQCITDAGCPQPMTCINDEIRSAEEGYAMKRCANMCEIRTVTNRFMDVLSSEDSCRRNSYVPLDGLDGHWGCVPTRTVDSYYDGDNNLVAAMQGECELIGEPVNNGDTDTTDNDNDNDPDPTGETITCRWTGCRANYLVSLWYSGGTNGGSEGEYHECGEWITFDLSRDICPWGQVPYGTAWFRYNQVNCSSVSGCNPSVWDHGDELTIQCDGGFTTHYQGHGLEDVELNYTCQY